VFFNSSSDTFTAPSHEKVWSVITEITYLSCQVAIQTPFPAHARTNISCSFSYWTQFLYDTLRLRLYINLWGMLGVFLWRGSNASLFQKFLSIYSFVSLTWRTFFVFGKNKLVDIYCLFQWYWVTITGVWNIFDCDISYWVKLLFWTLSIKGVLKPVHFGNVLCFSLPRTQQSRFSHMKTEIEQLSEI
jgi:hypothetical protein